MAHNVHLYTGTVSNRVGQTEFQYKLLTLRLVYISVMEILVDPC